MWSQLVGAALGCWLMVSPTLLGYGDPARMHDRIVGPIIASMALIVVWEVARPMRWANALLALWLLIAPWLLGYGGGARVNSLLVGMLLLGCSLSGGTYRPQRFGGGWRALWRDETPSEDRDATSVASAAGGR